MPGTRRKPTGLQLGACIEKFIWFWGMGGGFRLKGEMLPSAGSCKPVLFSVAGQETLNQTRLSCQ